VPRISEFKTYKSIDTSMNSGEVVINPLLLCNGTRISVKKMMNNIIEAKILNGKFKGEDVLLPLIPMILTDMHWNSNVYSFR